MKRKKRHRMLFRSLFRVMKVFQNEKCDKVYQCDICIRSHSDVGTSKMCHRIAKLE